MRNPAMPPRLARITVFCLAGVLFVAVGPAFAVITALTPLKKIVGEQEFIATVKVEKVDSERPAVVLTFTGDLKGKFPFKRLPVNLTGDKYAKENKHAPALLK